jgi:hypothetical protein
MQFINWLFKLIYYYEEDEKHGKPYWQDPAFVGLAVSIAATEAAKYLGVHIDSDLQLKIVGTVTGLGVVLSPHTGVKKAAPAAPATDRTGVPGSGHDLSSLS